jgi:hypothetical protein
MIYTPLRHDSRIMYWGAKLPLPADILVFIERIQLHQQIQFFRVEIIIVSKAVAE